MSAPVFEYAVYHPVLRTRLGVLEVREPKWTEVVNGGSTFTGKVTVPDNLIGIANIRQCTNPHRAALYATVPSNSRIMWGGPILGRKWNSDTNELSITAVDWRSWLYSIVLGPKADGTGTNTFVYDNVDQFYIARQIVSRMAADGGTAAGIPIIDYGSEMTGISRTMQITGMDFKNAGETLDALANLDRGFEWDIEPYYSNDGLPKLRFQSYFPQRGGVVPGLLFSKTPDGGNMLNVEDQDGDASGVARRVWAVGDGPNAESTPWGSDNDPELANGTVLRTDAVSSYTGALSRANLTSYARAERLYRTETLDALVFPARMDNPDLFSYSKGDRCRVLLQDRWTDLDVSNCRILSREMDPDNNTVKITVNLSDLALPEVDTGGAV